MKYERKKGCRYLIKNAIVTTALKRPEIFAVFAPSGDKFICDTEKEAEAYTQLNLKAHRIKEGKQFDAMKRETDKTIQDFIEKHRDFESGIITKKASKKAAPKKEKKK